MMTVSCNLLNTIEGPLGSNDQAFYVDTIWLTIRLVVVLMIVVTLGHFPREPLFVRCRNGTAQGSALGIGCLMRTVQLLQEQKRSLDNL